MDAEFSVELGRDDPTLAVPWTSPDGSCGYVDLSAHPEEIDRLSEVLQFQELGQVLHRLNAGGSPYRTAKCDAWFDTLMDVDDEPYESSVKCASYIDVYFAGEHRLAEFPQHEFAARAVVKNLRGLPDQNARVEIAIRRCYFLDAAEPAEALYWTLYAFGYGDDISEARAAWGRALGEVCDVLTAHRGLMPQI